MYVRVCEIKFYDYIGDSRAIIFSHTANFTPVCTTKVERIANYIGEFEKRGVKLLSLSSNEVDSHKAWLPDVEACTPGSKVTYPILVVPKAEIMVKLNMLDLDEKDEIGKPLASRTLHIVGPDKKERSHKRIKYADLLQNILISLQH
ncbi:1-Cys peroxiredoxin B [Cryptomeria japonica]|uniref:1-Cys peroxiredoxin B n=1 Tax=Cryptomeria japonica TaxID=3369 RepID=UPI0025AD92EE|nr:1-Cys peroxiredoxin B [Cryptomeria japonica]